MHLACPTFARPVIDLGVNSPSFDIFHVYRSLISDNSFSLFNVLMLYTKVISKT